MTGTVDTSYASDGENYKSITGATIHMACNTGSMLSMCAHHTIWADSSMNERRRNQYHLLVRTSITATIFFQGTWICSRESYVDLYG